MTRRLTRGLVTVALTVAWLLVGASFLASRAALAEDEVQKSPVPVVLSYAVNENVGERWHAIADHAQGKDIPFELVGSLPADLAYRKTMPYWFVVRIPDGLDYMQGTARVALVHEDGSSEDVTASLAVSYRPGELSAGTDDLRRAVPAAVWTDTLLLYYETRLNDATQMGYATGNRSWAHLEYEGDGTVGSRVAAMVPLARLAAGLSAMLAEGEADARDAGLQWSVEIPATVYSYELRVLKQASDTRAPLAGASFALRDAEGRWYVRGGDWTSDESRATVVTTDARGEAWFPLLDSDEYALVEVEAPEGYEPVDDIDVRIDSDVPGGQSATYLDAKSSAAVSTATDAAKGTIQVVVTDRPKEREIEIIPEDAAPRDEDDPLGRLWKQVLAVTGDPSLSALPLLFAAVLVLLCAVVVRRRARGRNVHKPSAGGGPADTHGGKDDDA